MQWHKHQPNFFLNSDTEIYNALLDAKKSGHELLKHFKILYPNKIPQNPINAIYVGRLETIHEAYDDTFDHYDWRVSTDIFITTKQYDKVDRYRMLKTATFAVMEVLLESKIGSFIKLHNQGFIYDNNNLIQMSRLSIYSRENSYKDTMKSEYEKVCKILTEISIEEEHKHKKRKKNECKEVKKNG